MSLNLFLLLISTLSLLTAQADIMNFTDSETCTDLCRSCNGIATIEDGRCECNIEEGIDEGAECVLRMRREATDHGLDLVSCDLSSDKRSTRCLLGSKLKLGKNDIDQVAKYFMEDGPITGSVFQAPPYTHPHPPDTLQSENKDCTEQPSLFILNTLQDTTQAPQPVQIVSSPQNQQTVSGSQHQHLVSSPQSPHVVSSPPSRHFISSPNRDYVGAPRIITQPKETMLAPKVVNYTPTQSVNNCGAALGNAAAGSNSPIVGDINPNLLRDQTNTPTFFQILGQQLSRSMFGIPHAIQTVSQTPGISDLVSAPANMLYTFLQRLNDNSNQVASTRKGSESQSVKVGIPKMAISNPNNNNISPVVGAQSPTFNYNYPTIGSPLISLLNPTVGVPAGTHVSYIQQMPSAMPASIPATMPATMPLSTMPMIHGPIVGSITPYNGFVPQIPTTYIVGAPLGLPYYTNYNTAAVPASSFNSVTQVEDSPSNFVEHIVEPSNDQNVGSSLFQSLKKICKKSTKEELPVKTIRDAKSISEYLTDEARFLEIKKQLEEQVAEKQVEQTLSEIPKIDRTTTQKSIIEKISRQKSNADKLTKDNDVIEKTKAEKFKTEKEIKNKSKPIKEIIKKPSEERKRAR